MEMNVGTFVVKLMPHSDTNLYTTNLWDSHENFINKCNNQAVSVYSMHLTVAHFPTFMFNICS